MSTSSVAFKLPKFKKNQSPSEILNRFKLIKELAADPVKNKIALAMIKQDLHLQPNNLKTLLEQQEII
jgi:formamidopyrimidine-DNA glycosylase|tara:strand:+ start:212 stop:415 length:204 start_codon:yes stop_codon:yes gene_type:complete